MVLKAAEESVALRIQGAGRQDLVTRFKKDRVATELTKDKPIEFNKTESAHSSLEASSSLFTDTVAARRL